MTADKAILTCALSGVVTTRRQCPAIPHTVEEYAREAKRAFDAGAAVVHIHARDDDGQPTYSPRRYREIADAIRAECPLVLNFSTGAVGLPIAERVAHIVEVEPHIGALNMGSMNYAKYSEKRRAFVFQFVFANPFDEIVHLLESMNAAGVKPELECFDTGHVASTGPLLHMGVLRPPLDFSLVMGVDGGIPATARHLGFQVENLPPGSTWKVVGVSRVQWMLVSAALDLGGHVRIGLEDNFYLPNGEMARSNGDLVSHAAAMVRATGRDVAGVDEAKLILGLQ